MSESIFRKESLDNIKSPDNIDQYIQVAHVSGWVVLLAVMLLLIGNVIWLVNGTIESMESVEAIVSDNTAVCSVSPDIIDRFSVGMTIRIDNTEGKVWKIDYNGNVVIAKIDVPDGVYKSVIVTDVIQPLSLIFD